MPGGEGSRPNCSRMRDVAERVGEWIWLSVGECAACCGWGEWDALLFAAFTLDTERSTVYDVDGYTLQDPCVLI